MDISASEVDFHNQNTMLRQLSEVAVNAVSNNQLSPCAAATEILQLPATTLRAHSNYMGPLEAEQIEQLHYLQRQAAELVNTLGFLDDKKQQLHAIIAKASNELSLRPWTGDDVDSYFAFLNDPTLWSMVPEDKPEPFTRDTAATLIETANSLSDRHLVYAVEQNGELIGQARLQFDSSTADESAEISYWLASNLRGRGLGTILIPFISNHFFKSCPQIRYLYADILATNAASQRVVTKAGYHYEGIETNKASKNQNKAIIKRHFALDIMYPPIL